MAVRFYWTLVVIAGGSQHREHTVVEEAQLMVERDAGTPGGVSREIILTIGARHLFSLPLRNADLGSTLWFMLAMQT
jgi:hypothetical protein